MSAAPTPVRLYPAAILDEIEGALQAADYLDRHLRELAPVGIHLPDPAAFPVTAATDHLNALRTDLWAMRATAEGLRR